jgi:type IV pilus assembly protein PilV
MLRIHLPVESRQRGTTMLEVLVTILILAFGMLGLGGLMTKMHLAEVESYQRAQAVLLLADMVERINANRSAAAAYKTISAVPAYLGVGDNQLAACGGLAIGAARDQCEWSNLLKGASETKAAQSAGAMLGARGCVEELQVPNPAAGVCTPGVYRVTVTWQGFNPTAAPALLCASGLYGAQAGLQRAIATTVTVGLPRC